MNDDEAEKQEKTQNESKSNKRTKMKQKISLNEYILCGDGNSRKKKIEAKTIKCLRDE